MAGTDMNDIDRTRLDGLETKLDSISRDVSRLTNAVIGDEQAGNYGIVARIAKLEEKDRLLWAAIDKCKDDTEANREKINKIFAYSAAIAAAIGTLFSIGKFIFDMAVR